MGKFIIVPDVPEDQFTVSKCECALCKEMNDQKEYDFHIPQNQMQRRLKDVIAKIQREATRDQEDPDLDLLQSS